MTDLTRVLDKADPRDTAHRIVQEFFTDDGIRTLQYYQEDFYIYQGSCYRRLHKDEVRNAIWHVLKDARMRVRDPVKQKLVLAPFKPRPRNVDEVLDALKAECEVSAWRSPPFWLANPPGHPAGLYAAGLLPVANGLLEVSTGRLYEPTPALFVESASGVAYDPNAPAPAEWKKFLDQVLDRGAQRVLQTVMGYLLVRNTSFQKIFMLIGPKRSGKGTIASVLEALLGGGGIASASLQDFSDRFGLQKLIGKPLCIVPDARFGRRNDAPALAERLLSISGEDVVNVPRKFLGDWIGRLPTRFLILTNEMPQLQDTSGALADRFIILKTKKSFFGKEDRQLRRRLLRELPGILNWAVAGYQRLMREGKFAEPASSSAYKQLMHAVMAPIATFIEERCELGPHLQVSKKELYTTYRRWCEEVGMKASPSHVFGRDLLAARPEVGETRPAGGDRRRCYKGIALGPAPGARQSREAGVVPFAAKAKSAS